MTKCGWENTGESDYQPVILSLILLLGNAADRDLKMLDKAREERACLLCVKPSISNLTIRKPQPAMEDLSAIVEPFF